MVHLCNDLSWLIGVIFVVNIVFYRSVMKYVQAVNQLVSPPHFQWEKQSGIDCLCMSNTWMIGWMSELLTSSTLSMDLNQERTSLFTVPNIMVVCEALGFIISILVLLTDKTTWLITHSHQFQFHNITNSILYSVRLVQYWQLYTIYGTYSDGHIVLGGEISIVTTVGTSLAWSIQ